MTCRPKPTKHVRFLATGIAVVSITVVSSSRSSIAAPVELRPHVSLSEQYNDNIFFDDRRKDDFITGVGVGLGLTYRGRRLNASLNGGTRAQFFAKSTRENDLAGQQHGTVTATYEASPRLRLAVSDSLTHVDRTRTGGPLPASEAPAEGGELPPPGTDASTLLSRGDAFSNFFAARGSYLFAPRWSGELAYQNSVSDFDNPGGTDLTNRVGLTGAYAWSETIGLNASYNYSRLDFSGEDATDTESHSISLGAGYNPDPLWSFAASAGVYVNNPLSSNHDSASTRIGPTFNLTATRAFERVALTAGASQQITTSGGVAGVSTTRTFFGQCDARLYRRLNGFVRASYSHFDTSQTNLDVAQVHTGLTFPVWRYFDAGLTYSYRLRDSSNSTTTTSQGTVDGNVVRLFVSASYPVWRDNW